MAQVTDNINLSQKTHIFISRVEHSAKIMKSIDDIFQKQLFTDVCLSCENQVIYAHRLILAAASSFFYSLFSTQPCSIAPNPVVVIRDTRINELKAILEFIYYGQVAVQESEVDSLIKSAQTLGVYGLGKIDLQKIDQVKRDDEPIAPTSDNAPVVETPKSKKKAAPEVPLKAPTSAKIKEKKSAAEKEPRQSTLTADKDAAKEVPNDKPSNDQSTSVLDSAAEAKKKLAEVAQRLMAHTYLRTTEPPGLSLPDDFEPTIVLDVHEPEVISNFGMDEKQLEDHLRMKRKRSRGGVSLLKNGSSASSTSSIGCAGNGAQVNSAALSPSALSAELPIRQSARISGKKKGTFGEEPHEKKCKSSSLSNFPIFAAQSLESTGNDLEGGRLSPTPSDSSIVRNTKRMRALKKKFRFNKMELMSKAEKHGKSEAIGSEDELMSIVNSELDAESLDDHKINILMADADPEAYEINNNSSNNNDMEADEEESACVTRTKSVQKRRSSCTLPVSGRSSTCSANTLIRDKKSRKSRWKDGVCSEVSESDTDECHSSRILNSAKRMLLLSKYQAVSLLADGGSGIKITKSNAKPNPSSDSTSAAAASTSTAIGLPGETAAPGRAPSSNAISNLTRKKVN
jgi:hypothetical protein